MDLIPREFDLPCLRYVWALGFSKSSQVVFMWSQGSESVMQKLEALRLPLCPNQGL